MNDKEQIKEDIFFVAILNKPYSNEYGQSDIHIERFLSKKKLNDYFKSILTSPDFSYYDLIITNNKKWLNHYFFVLNEDELKLLCSREDYEEGEIRINPSYYYYSLSKEVYNYFLKVKSKKIISATMDWRMRTTYPYDHDPSHGVSFKEFNGWLENKKFKFFENGDSYLKQKYLIKFKYHYLNTINANLEELNKLFNTNILEIDKNDNTPYSEWEFHNDFLRYYDEISMNSLYISIEHLNILRDKNDVVFIIKTILDKNEYLKYYVIGIEEII